MLLRVEGKFQSPSVFIFLKAESEAYPLYRIENRSDETLMILQKGSFHFNSQMRYLIPLFSRRTAREEMGNYSSPQGGQFRVG